MLVPFIMLYKVVLAFETMHAILMCGDSNKNFLEVLSCAAESYAVQPHCNL